MTLESWVDPRIGQVTANQIRLYLLGHGWQPRPYPRPELMVFEGLSDDDGQPIVLTIPSSERMRDFRVRAAEIIGTLGILEDRYAVRILDEMLRVGDTNGGPPQLVATQVTPAGK